MDKKAQIQRIFFYIVAIFIFAVILLFGYKAIHSFIEKGKKVELIQFKNDLESAIRDLAIQYGDQIVFNEKNPMRVPSGFSQVCFVSPSAKKDDIPGEYEYAHIKAAVEQNLHNSTENVFLIPPAEISIFVGPIEIWNSTSKSPQEFACLKIEKGRINFKIEGRGDKTRIYVK